MNPQFKQNILNAIANGTVVNVSRWGAMAYTVYGPNKEKLIEVNCDYDYGKYFLIIGGKTVLSVDQNTTHKNLPIQSIIRELNDICRACGDRLQIQGQLQDAEKQMTAIEKQLSEYLAGANIKKK